MIKSIKSFLISTFSALALMSPVAVPAVVGAQDIQENLCQGSSLSVTGGQGCAATGEAETAVDNIIETVINVFSIVVGVIAVIFIIIGGFKYITSGGNDSSVASARNTIMYAIVGLVIVALAQIAVRFVLNRVTTT